MKRLVTLAATEARLLVRDWTVLTFAFVFPAFVMLILAGVFGSEPDDGYDMKRPDDYYVAASIGVPMIALALVGLPVALASASAERLEAFGVSVGRVVAAQAVVTCGLIVLGAGIVLALAVPTYGVPHVVHPFPDGARPRRRHRQPRSARHRHRARCAERACGAGYRAACVLPRLPARRRRAATRRDDRPDAGRLGGVALYCAGHHGAVARRLRVQLAARGARRLGSGGARSELLARASQRGVMELSSGPSSFPAAGRPRSRPR
jgi:hypothetical protein